MGWSTPSAEGGGRVRGHLFVRTVLGVWACSNPDCVPGHAEARRNIGRLYDQPRYHCDNCGGRVLELLYCETCGDVFLGGYYTQVHDGLEWQLFPDSPDLEGIPERARLGKNATTYMLYWPQRDDPTLPTTNPHWNRGDYHFAFRKSSLRAPRRAGVQPASRLHRLDVPCQAEGRRRPEDTPS